MDLTNSTAIECRPGESVTCARPDCCSDCSFPSMRIWICPALGGGGVVKVWIVGGTSTAPFNWNNRGMGSPAGTTSPSFGDSSWMVTRGGLWRTG